MHQRFSSCIAIPARTAGSLALALALAMCVAPTAHAAPLMAGLGGPVGYGVGILPANDDGYSTSAIDLSSAFPGGLRFYGGPYRSFWVNNNGNITFRTGLSTYTPDSFPGASQPIIAPYWADVDTRGSRPAGSGVYWHVAPGLLVVTWHRVGYYNSHQDRQMDFQLIIRNALDCGSGSFDVEFRYNVCGWETGDASGGSGGFGGTEAVAGFDSGNGTDYVTIPGSEAPGISTALCTGSNVGMPGIWQFGIRGGSVACPGSGELCDTGMLGACGIGATQCRGEGVVCAPIGTPSAERCDGVDNDCDGAIDGEGLCGASEVCAQGRCIPVCFEGGCDEGESCDATGFCVETACVDVACPPGQRCEGGACLGACEGISCPHGQQCVAGRCTDLCDVLECDVGEICVDGACVPECPCRACGADEICGADGSCTPVGCDVVVCEPGFYCRAGGCLDACDGAVCPPGQRCAQGECIDAPVGVDAGTPTGVDGGGGELADAGTPTGVDGGVDGGRPRPPRDRGGCSCAVPGHAPAPAWAFVLAGLGVAITWRRRR